MQDLLNKLAAKFALAEDGSYRLHPLICHMVDVAVVAQALWDDCLAERVRSDLSRSFALDPDFAQRWVAFLAGVHDLGKATPVFQAKGSMSGRSTPPWLLGTELEFQPLTVRDPGHGTVTAASLPAFLQARFAMASVAAQRLAVITGGHHGIFPSAQSRQRARGISLGEPRLGDSNPWDAARIELVTTLADLLDVESSPGRLSNAASMLLAGFISVVDWIGSIDDPRFFPYAPDGPDDLAAYAAGRKERAHEALRLLHWDALPRPDIAARFQDLFPSFSPRPLQVCAQQMAPQLSSPGVAILEAPMGEGKTEAAWYLGDYWNSAGFRGSYTAMPTQATSNQHYERFETFLRGRYRTGEQINLQLLHGHAALKAEMEILRTGQVVPAPAGIDLDGDDREATVGAAEWFTYRKRGLLAPFGVGTIDQALLSVLQVKHGFVRLFGLAGKTVIVDEVHAYDTYMTTLLERLLEWLAALGSPVVILSATLPSARRLALVNAYYRGLGRPDAELPAESYPRITWTGAGKVEAMTVGTSPDIRRTLGLRWLPSGVEGLPEHLCRELGEGGCAAVVCNTVNRAQETYAALRDAFAALPEAERPGLDLFHARFLFKDREEREERCLQSFGKPEVAGGTTAGRPIRSVLVATQVIEQSLDLDFDIMVTELAPIDLLLQRSGRLHRHRRADRRGVAAPVLEVFSPQLGDDGLPRFERANTFIYDEHILLRTWHHLQGRANIAIPEEIEGLIEAVYNESGEPPAGATEALAARWTATFDTMEVKRKGREALANQPLIPSPGFDEEEFFEISNVPLLEDRPDVARVRQARTRYEDLPTLPVVWLRAEDAAKAEIRKGDRDAVRELMMCSASLRGYWVASLYGDQFLPSSWRDNALLRHHRLVTVTDDRYQIPDGPELSLDEELGMVIRFKSRTGTEEVQPD